MTRITPLQYQDATDLNLGWCFNCLMFTRDEVEPEEREAFCPECKCDTVVGAEDALARNLITIEEDL